MGAATDTVMIATTIPEVAAHMVLADTPEWDRIIVEYADRLTDAGVNYWTTTESIPSQV